MKTILLIDPQVDFITGSLAVEGAEEKMNELTEFLNEKLLTHYSTIILTLDWHPITHCSFVRHGGSWPQHCIAHTFGALPWPPIMESVLGAYEGLENVFVRVKGQDPAKEEYGAFEGEVGGALLSSLERSFDIDVAGIMSEYCVLESLKGLVKKHPWIAPKLNVLLKYVATMDNHGKLITWLKENNIRYDNGD